MNHTIALYPKVVTVSVRTPKTLFDALGYMVKEIKEIESAVEIMRLKTLPSSFYVHDDSSSIGTLADYVNDEATLHVRCRLECYPQPPVVT